MSSSGVVRIGSWRPSRSEVSYIRYPVSSAFLFHHRHHRLRFLILTFFCFLQPLVCRLGCRAVSHPIGRIFRSALSGSVGFWCYFTARYCSLFSASFLGLKQWSRKCFLVHYFSRVRFHGVFGSVSCSLYFFGIFFLVIFRCDFFLQIQRDI